MAASDKRVINIFISLCGLNFFRVLLFLFYYFFLFVLRNDRSNFAIVDITVCGMSVLSTKFENT